jgi:M6 family metalloprotease-like protein
MAKRIAVLVLAPALVLLLLRSFVHPNPIVPFGFLPFGYDRDISAVRKPDLTLGASDAVAWNRDVPVVGLREASSAQQAKAAGSPHAAPPFPSDSIAVDLTPSSGVGPQAVGNPIPRFGDQKLLIILADFPDRPGLFTGQAWQHVFFAPGGFADYFSETSYGQLCYSGDVVGLSSGDPVTNSAEAAYVRLPYPITYYADGMYGFNFNPGNFPRNNGGVVYHALQELDVAGFDFSAYADPLTNRVENLVVIFAGSSYAYVHDPDNSLRPTAYRLTWASGGVYTSSGGQTVDNYTLCPDQDGDLSGEIGRMGVCAHEHGHALGMVDLYDRSYETSGIGYYDMMAYGCYGAGADGPPFQFSVFSKEFFGWITPTVASVGESSFTLSPAETTASFIKLYPHANTSSEEYFLLENRQPVGFDQDWLENDLCGGMLIWHVDQDIVEQYPHSVNVPASQGGPPHQGVIVVEADGDFDMINAPPDYGECSDTWTPGQTWDANSTPDSHLWDGTSSGLSVTVVSQQTDSVKLRVSVSSPLSVTHEVFPRSVLPGEQLTYTLRITNVSNTDLQLSITNTLSAHVTPTGVLTLTPTVPAFPGAWTRTIPVTTEASYTGPLLNVVRLKAADIAMDEYTTVSRALVVHGYLYLPLVLAGH